MGLGFVDRSDSFDFNVALQDHFKWVKKSEQIQEEEQAPKKDLDLRFKEGETIKINMKITVLEIFLEYVLGSFKLTSDILGRKKMALMVQLERNRNRVHRLDCCHHRLVL